MSYREIWPSFVDYLSTSKAFAEHRDRFITYFGNRKDPPTGFANRALALYNPISNRKRFDCGYRFCVNVYSSCDHGCQYCYVNGYSGGVGRGKRTPGLLKRLRNDITDFRRLAMPPGPVHVSNSTDPLQERLEDDHGDTYETVAQLCTNRELFSEVILLTKNPALLLAEGRGYTELLQTLGDRLTVEVSVAFAGDNYRIYEPGAPHPESRLGALRRLIGIGLIVRLRLDPLFPRQSGLQTEDDIVNILDAATGVECVVSKPLRLVKRRKIAYDPFFEEMWPFYAGGSDNGVEWHGGRYVFSKARCEEEMAFLRQECARRRVPLVHCKDTVLVDDQGVPVLRRRLEAAERDRRASRR